MRSSLSVTLLSLLACETNAFSLQTDVSDARKSKTSISRPSSRIIDSTKNANAKSNSHLLMNGFPHSEEDIPTLNKRNSGKHHSDLSAASIAIGVTQEQDALSFLLAKEDDNSDGASNQLLRAPSFFQDSVIPVLSTAFLITANTVGASCLILPDLAAGPGFMNTCIVSLGVYIINLVSGLCMAEVAIKQYEADGADVPSSFKEFADKSFQSDIVANIIATISILTNACVLVFTFAKAGEMASTLLAGAVDPTVASLGFVTALGAMMSTFTAGNLSTVASMCVGALFVAFGGFLIPGLVAVQDPWGTLTAPGIDASLSSVGQVVPIILLSLVYQNIVPSVTKILNYDRKKTVASLSLGSFIPLAMYLLFCFASLGGGLDVSSAGGPLMTLFTLATIGGSSVGTSMSVAEEFDSFFKTNEKDQTSAATSEEDELAENYVFSLPAVVAALVVPVLGDMLAGEDMTGALSLAGSFGSPLLYGVVPAIMAWNQRQEEKRQQQNLVPGGFASLGALGLAATGFVGQELAHVMDAVALAVA